MIPRWLFELEAKDRARSVSGVDEHGRPVEEEVPPARPGEVYVGCRQYPPQNQSQSHRAFPGYKEFPKNR